MPDTLSLTFSALADPTRRAMLARLSKGQANVSDLAKPFLNEMSLPAVTKHLKVLEQAGYLSVSKPLGQGRVRTWVKLTASGRRAFDGHVAALRQLLADGTLAPASASDPR